MSPEMRNSESNSFKVQHVKSDIFSLGLIALYCLDPIEFENHNTVNFNSDEIVLEKYLDNYRERCPNNHFYYILRSMLSFSTFTRPSIEQLYHDFFLIGVSQPLSPQCELVPLKSDPLSHKSQILPPSRVVVLLKYFLWIKNDLYIVFKNSKTIFISIYGQKKLLPLNTYLFLFPRLSFLHSFII